MAAILCPMNNSPCGGNNKNDHHHNNEHAIITYDEQDYNPISQDYRSQDYYETDASFHTSSSGRRQSLELTTIPHQQQQCTILATPSTPTGGSMMQQFYQRFCCCCRLGNYYADNEKNRQPLSQHHHNNKSPTNSWWRSCNQSCCHSPCCYYPHHHDSIMTALKRICTNPFGMFVTVAVVSNLPPMLIALTEIKNIHTSNDNNNNALGGVICPASVWLLTNFVFCWIHILASLYVALSINTNSPRRHIHDAYPPQQQSQSRSSQHQERQLTTKASTSERSIFQRACHLFCYDPIMAFYMFIVLLYIGLLLVPKVLTWDQPPTSYYDWTNTNNNGDGNNEANNNNNNNNSKNPYQDLMAAGCSPYIHEKVIASVGFAWAFLMFGIGALGLSFTFAYVDDNNNNTTTNITRDQDRHHAISRRRISAMSDDLETQGTYTTLEDGYEGNNNTQTKKSFWNGTNNKYAPPMIMALSSRTDAEQGSTTNNPYTTYDDDDETDGVGQSTMEDDTTTMPKQYTTDFATEADGDDTDYAQDQEEDDDTDVELGETDVELNNETLGGATTTDFETDALVDGTIGAITNTDFETDGDDLGITSLDYTAQASPKKMTRPKTKYAGHKAEQRGRSFGTTTVSCYDDEDDPIPITSYDVPDTETEGGFTNDRYIGETSFESNNNDGVDQRRMVLDLDGTIMVDVMDALNVDPTIDLSDFEGRILTSFDPTLTASASISTKKHQLSPTARGKVTVANLDLVMQDSTFSDQITISVDGNSSLDDTSVGSGKMSVGGKSTNSLGSKGSVRSKGSRVSFASVTSLGRRLKRGITGHSKRKKATSSKSPAVVVLDKPLPRKQARKQSNNNNKTMQKVAEMVSAHLVTTSTDDGEDNFDIDKYIPSPREDTKKPGKLSAGSFVDTEPLSFVDGGGGRGSDSLLTRGARGFRMLHEADKNLHENNN